MLAATRRGRCNPGCSCVHISPSRIHASGPPYPVATSYWLRNERATVLMRAVSARACSQVGQGRGSK